MPARHWFPLATEPLFDGVREARDVCLAYRSPNGQLSGPAAVPFRQLHLMRQIGPTRIIETTRLPFGKQHYRLSQRADLIKLFAVPYVAE
jgi:hypothetical protein